MQNIIKKARNHLFISIHKKRLKNNNITFGKKVTIDGDSYFEGYNHVGSHSALISSKIGLGSYIAPNSYIRNTDIGRYCSIGKNVRIIDVTHPSKDFVSTSPSFFSVNPSNHLNFTSEQKFDEFLYFDEKEKISLLIGNDVWIGDGVQILGGHKIGNGAIVAAGSVVTKDIPPYSIVGGVPAKIIRFRFTQQQIEFLEQFKWWEKDVIWLKDHVNLFEDINFFMAELQS